MQRSRFIAVGVSLALALGLGACGNAASTGATSEQDKKLAASMYTWISNENDREQWMAFVNAAQKKDPNFTIAMEGPSFADYWTKVKTRMQAADAPCLLTTQAARANELGALLAPLDDLAKKNSVDLTKYNKAMMTGMTIDGKVRAVPYDAEPTVLFYNKDMFAKAGLKEPGLNYTRDQFLSDAKALTKDGKYGFAISPELLGASQMAFIYSEGHSITTKDGKLNLTDPAVAADVQWSLDLVSKQKVAKLPGASDDASASQQEFLAGNAAMVIDGPWTYSMYTTKASGKVGVAVIPTTSGKPKGYIQGSGFGIASNCKDKDAAFQNIMKITTSEVIGEVGRTRGTVPSLDSAVPAWATGKSDSDVAAVKALLAEGQPFITPPNFNQVQTLSQQNGSPGTSGQKSATELLKLIQDSVA